MENKRFFRLLTAPILGALAVVFILLFLRPTPASSQGADESTLEAEKARASEQSPGHVRQAIINPDTPLADHELFVGVDDLTVPAYRIDVNTNDVISAFVGIEVWGAAYDYDNDRVFFSDGVDLYEWSVAGDTITFLATVSDTLGTNVSMEGLAYAGGTLYASKVGTTGEGEGIYSVDLSTFQATRVIAYTDPALTTISGIDADPVTGQIYGVNDNSALRGLVQIDMDGTVTVVADYPGGETDVDGLAVGGGKAYLITDDNTPQYFDVFDFGVMTYTGVVTNPWTTAEVFAGGAWISPATPDSITCNGPTIGFEAGLPANWSIATTTGPVYWTTTDDLNGCDNPIETGGSGQAACADADETNSAGNPYDTELWTNAFDLSGYVSADLNLQWRHRQLNNSVFDIDISTDGGSSWTNVVNNTTGNPSGAAGDFASIDLASFVGQTSVIARFRYYGDAWDWYAQIDDVALSCQTELVPEISLQKTVGTDPNTCATSDNIYVTPGTDVTYCYEVSNTGTLTLTLHDLDDSELGPILSGFPFSLSPGASVFLTTTATINASTVNTATWTAYNPGPTDLVTATDTASVNVVQSAAFPVCADFESGALPDFMYPQATTSGLANGRVQVTTAFPHTGLYGLDIDTDCDGCGGSTEQSATMLVDLAGESNVKLDFWVFEHGDENDAEDGVFISDDGGVTWAQIFSLNDFPANYENVQLDLVAAAAGVGMNMVDGFQIRFQNLDNFSIPTDGYSFDDICVLPDVPEITLAKTVGTDPGICAVTDNVEVPPGTDVTYCYEVTNTGNFTLTLHDLDDSELGSILSGFPFSLTPGASAYLTQTATINASTVNTATWTAYNPGPTDVATATDTASVTIIFVPEIQVDPASLASSQYPDALERRRSTWDFFSNHP